MKTSFYGVGMRGKILIVDDEPDVEIIVRQIFSKSIRSQELEFLFAENGLKALEKIRVENELDLVLTDINMPEMDGLTLLRKIKELSPVLKSIVISSYDDMSNIRTAMNFGAFDFITKPLDINDLELTITKALEHVQKIKANLRLKKNQEIAVAQSRKKGRFLSTMSHEIRTPLNAILGMTELLRETDLSRQQQQYIHVLDIAGETLLDIVNNILDLSKIEAGCLELESVNFNLRDLIKNIVRMMAVRSDEKELHLTTNIAPQVPDYIKGDPARLRQILINLIGNAIKFTKIGEIRLEIIKTKSEKDYDCLEFCVSDTGIGVPEDKLDKIFETYSQADPSTARHYGGTGLGLAICKNLVQAMKGRMWVKSRLGEGSRFYFMVLVESGSKPASATASADFNRQMTEPFMPLTRLQNPSTKLALQILLVDDSEHNRMVIKHHLRPFCRRIDCADSGQVAVDLFKKGRYDLVLMDMQMPIMDGRSATQLIRKWEFANKLRQVPIIGLTAYALKDEVQAILQTGCSATLIKPLRKSKLLNVIDKFCLPKNGEAQNELLEKNGNHHVVHVPPNMRALVQRYLNDMKKEVQTCFTVLEQNDFETVKTFGHRLKGSGGAYGFDKLTQLGACIEQLAADCRSETTYKFIQEVQTYLNTVRIIYEEGAVNKLI